MCLSFPCAYIHAQKSTCCYIHAKVPCASIHAKKSTCASTQARSLFIASARTLPLSLSDTCTDSILLSHSLQFIFNFSVLAELCCGMEHHEPSRFTLEGGAESTVCTDNGMRSHKLTDAHAFYLTHTQTSFRSQVWYLVCGYWNIFFCNNNELRNIGKD